MNMQLNDSGVPILREKTTAQKIKGVLLWIILGILAFCAGILVYVCLVASKEMGELATFEKIGEYPLYTMEYVGYEYDDIINSNTSTNDAVLKHFKNKLFKPVPEKMLPTSSVGEISPKKSIAAFASDANYLSFKIRSYDGSNTQIAVITTEPKEGFKSLNIVDLADVGIKGDEVINPWYNNLFQVFSAAYAVSEGINREGFSVSLISSPEADCIDHNDKPNISPFMAVRIMLDRALTVQNAIDILDDYDIDFSSGKYHFFVTERDYKSAVIEYVNGQMTVTPIDEKNNGIFQICTNAMEHADDTVKDYENEFDGQSIRSRLEKAYADDIASGGKIYVSYGALLIGQHCTTPNADRVGTQYMVVYNFNNNKISITLRNDEKMKHYFDMNEIFSLEQ